MDKEELKKIKIEYKNKINIPNIPFGIEIEFAQAEFETVRTNLKKILGYDPVKLTWNNKKLEIDNQYTTWKLKNEITVQESPMESRYIKLGGEINSPIMKNTKKYWQELKLICETLNQTENIKITGDCSIHIHTSKTIYNRIQEYKNLLKLIMIYEDIIYRINYGETIKIRNLLTTYAKSMSYYIYENINKLDEIEEEQDILKFLRYNRKFSFNFTNIGLHKKQTIENRIPNGTLNENIIQNHILFNNNLLNYAKIENYDNEFIEYKTKQYKPLFLNETLKENQTKAEELINLILKEEQDKLYILKQYLKSYDEQDIEKKYYL